MKLSSLTIKNYRALDEITLSLNPCMNVLYGTNGAGKSSILYALHDFLGLLFSQEIAPPDFRLFPGRAVREHNRDTAIGLCFSNGCTVSATLRPDVVYREPVTVASGWRQSCQLADGNAGKAVLAQQAKIVFKGGGGNIVFIGSFCRCGEAVVHEHRQLNFFARVLELRAGCGNGKRCQAEA